MFIVGGQSTSMEDSTTDGCITAKAIFNLFYAYRDAAMEY